MNRFNLGPLFALSTVLSVGLGLSFAGCGDSGTDDPVEECEGGVIVDGVCEGKCDPSLCVENNVCVGNRCMLSCTSHNQCFAPFKGDAELQGCLAATADSGSGLNDGDAVFVCTTMNKALKIGTPCPLGDECDDPATPDDWACPDGSPCTEGVGSDVCAADACKALTCRSTGVGDAEAYCTTVDCTADADCGPGMYCGITRDPTNICGTMKGEEMPCLDPGAFTAGGATFQEGPISLLRNVCLEREPCAPCEAATDCSLREDMQCVQINDFRGCAKTCTTEDDCRNDYACTGGFCTPRTGSCKPPATDNFCHPCLNDLDCGTAQGTVACETTAVDQKACFDTSFPDTCTTNADCPESPSGKNGECLDEGEGLSPGDGAYQRCYFPFYQTQGSFECYPD